MSGLDVAPTGLATQETKGYILFSIYLLWSGGTIATINILIQKEEEEWKYCQGLLLGMGNICG